MGQFFGVEKFRIQKGTQDYNPTTWNKIFPRLKIKILKGYSPFTGTLNVKTIKKYFEWEVQIDDITQAEWDDVLEYIEGETFVFTPHIDRPDLMYKCYATDLNAVWSGNDYNYTNATFRIVQIATLGIETWTGYYSFDGVDDKVVTPITANGSIWSIELDFNATPLTSLSYCWLVGAYNTGTDKWVFGFDSGSKLFYQYYNSGVLESYYIDTSAITKDNDWHTVKLEVNHTAKTVNIYYDSDIARTLTPSTIESGTLITGKTLQINNINPKPTNIYMRNMEFISSITANSFTYPMSEIAPYTDNFTDYTKDSSGNSNDGTPTNIDKTTFFNRDLV